MNKRIWITIAIIIIIQAVLFMQVDCALAASLYAKDSSWKIALKDECTTANNLTSLVNGSTCIQLISKGGEPGVSFQVKQQLLKAGIFIDYTVETGKLLYEILNFGSNIKDEVSNADLRIHL